MELVTGQAAIIKGTPHIHISQWIAGKSIESAVDPRLQATIYSIDSVRKAKETAMACLKMRKIERPDISWVYSELKDALKIEMRSKERTEYYSSKTFEMNAMDTENGTMEGSTRGD